MKKQVEIEYSSLSSAEQRVARELLFSGKIRQRDVTEGSTVKRVLVLSREQADLLSK